MDIGAAWGAAGAIYHADNAIVRSGNHCTQSGSGYAVEHADRDVLVFLGGGNWPCICRDQFTGRWFYLLS